MRPRSAGSSKDHLLSFVYQHLHHPTWHTLSSIEGSNGLPSVRARWRGYNESYLRGTYIYTYTKHCFAVISGSADRCARNGRRSRRPQGASRCSRSSINRDRRGQRGGGGARARPWVSPPSTSTPAAASGPSPSVIVFSRLLVSRYYCFSSRPFKDRFLVSWFLRWMIASVAPQIRFEGLS